MFVDELFMIEGGSNMDPTEGLKRLFYSRFLHLSHMTEQIFTTEVAEFADLARLHGLSSIPNNMTSIHVLDCIGNHEPINNTAIAEKMNLSKASITKISSKLLEEAYIKRSRMNDNKKEVYFSLSPKGRQLFEVHATLHEMMEHRFIKAMDAFSESEIHTLLKFYQMMIDQKDNILKGEKED